MLSQMFESTNLNLLLENNKKSHHFYHFTSESAFRVPLQKKLLLCAHVWIQFIKSFSEQDYNLYCPGAYDRTRIICWNVDIFSNMFQK